jgi:hypothetical protein
MVLGLVHVDLPPSLRALVALRYRRHFLCRILVNPPHRVPWSPEHQHTSKHGTRREVRSTNLDSGMTSKKKTRDQPQPSHRTPPSARIASSTRSGLVGYLRQSPAVRTADPVTR